MAAMTAAAVSAAARRRASLQKDSLRSHRRPSSPLPLFVLHEVKPKASKAINTDFEVILSDLPELLRQSRKTKYCQKKFIKDYSETDTEEYSATSSPFSTPKKESKKKKHTSKHVKKNSFSLNPDKMKMICEIAASKTHIDSLTSKNSQNKVKDLSHPDEMIIEASQVLDSLTSENLQNLQSNGTDLYNPDEMICEIEASKTYIDSLPSNNLQNKVTDLYDPNGMICEIEASKTYIDNLTSYNPQNKITNLSDPDEMVFEASQILDSLASYHLQNKVTDLYYPDEMNFGASKIGNDSDSDSYANFKDKSFDSWEHERTHFKNSQERIFVGWEPEGLSFASPKNKSEEAWEPEENSQERNSDDSWEPKRIHFGKSQDKSTQDTEETHFENSQDQSCKARKPKKNSHRKKSEEWTPEKTCPDKIESRILQLKKLWLFIESLLDHCLRCLTKPAFVKEKRSGLYSEFVYKCPKCRETITLNNSEHILQDKKTIYCINLQSVLASLSTGLGYSAMNEIFSLHDVVYMNTEQYKKHEKILEPEIGERVKKSLTENLKLEINIATTENKFDEGFPAISCVGDARWSKRSYNHKYNANSATGVLIGSNTKKILYAGIKNKYCYTCQQEIRKGERKVHTCYKNWSGPSTSMETALIIEGFRELENKGARVMQYIGDQDSSVIKNIYKSFDWGKRVSKIDCLNHKIKNFTNFLIDWKKRNQLGRKFTETMIHHYRALMRKLISEKSDTPDYLRKHIPITADHLLGEHKECDELYCTAKYKFPVLNISKIAYDELKGYLQKSIVNRVERLKKGVTSNLAEAFFSVNAKFDNGKAKNFIQSGSYQLRSLCAVLDWNEGTSWNYDIIRTFLNVDSDTLKYFFKWKKYKHESSKKSKQTLAYKQRKKRKYYEQAKERDNNDYGPNADQDDDPPKQ